MSHPSSELDTSIGGQAVETSTPGFRAAQWRILFATMFCYLFFYTGRQTFGFAIPGIQEELGLSKTQLGLASAVLLWSYAIGQAINGNLGDKFGGRRMMSLGAVTSCGLNWMVSFGSGLWSLMIPWGANGLAQSMGWAPGSRVLSNWWGHHERGKVYGLYVFAAGMSSVLSFVTSLLIIQTFAMDWRWIFRLPVLLLLLGGVTYYLVVRDRPEDLGYPGLADEGADDLNDERIDGTAIERGVCARCGYSIRADHEHGCPECGADLAPADAVISPDDFDDTSQKRYLHVLKNWRFLIASVAIGFQSLARYGLLIWVPVHFLGATWKKDPDGQWISLALAVGMAAGALISGILSDKVFKSRRWPLICLFMSLAAVASLSMFLIPTGASYRWLSTGMLFLCGFFVYGPQSAFWALCPDLLGHRRAGTGTGVMNAFAYVFAGVGEPIIGLTLESFKDVDGHDFTKLIFPIVAGACLISATISLFIRR